MKGFVKFNLISAVIVGLLFAAIPANQAESTPSVSVDGKEYNINQSDEMLLNNNSREEIILWEEDFESGENGWSFNTGWNLTTSSSHSESHSAHSPNDNNNLGATFNLLSPTIALSDLGDGETMNFGFWLYANLPDSDGDGDNYLEDYYAISILDLAALAWHSSDHNSDAIGGDGENFWCADEEEVGGYLDSWIQYLDTPPVTVGAGGEFSASVYYAIEDPAGASVGGSCTDGWDAANIRISTDGGNSWDLLEDSANPYHFDCGYGWIWNDEAYDTGGSLNHLAAGWGGQSGRWKDFSANLSAYAGEEVIVRFAFGSDPAYSTIDDGSITGFQVDNLLISDNSGTLFSSNGEDISPLSVSGEVWVDQFYDYGSCTDERPGCSDWEEYLPGMPFNGNVFLDITDFAGKDVIVRIQSRYDENHDGGQGDGLHIDDFKIYKISGGNYPAPMGLAAEPGDTEVSLSWNDMNASGTADFIFDNDNVTNSIQMSTEGASAWAGERIDLAGASTVNSLSIYNVNAAGTSVSIAGFGALGTLINNEPTYTEDVVLSSSGWNTINVSGWDFNNAYIVAHQFTYDILAGLDESAVPSTNSMVLFQGGSWDLWSVAGASVGDGEWGIRANVTYEGANVTYNVYRDGASVASGLSSNSHTDTGLTNNVTYEYTVSATYSDGEESGESDPATATPFANSVHEEAHDDGSFESDFNAGSGNFSAVRYNAISSGEDIVRFKWHQTGTGGAFYIKIFEDDGGMPGSEIYSTVQASGNSDGWNDKDLSAQGLNVTGAFWVGTKEFSSSKPFGLDTDSNAGVSYQRTGSSGDWTQVNGNLAYRILLDCGDNCDEEGCTNDPGDVNEDGTVNILDIVQVANHVLGGGLVDCGLEAADLNGDGMVNILDIVQIVNVILEGRDIDAASAIIINDGASFNIIADGYIGGVQMTLTHGSDFELNLTKDALYAKSVTEGNKTTLIVVVPEGEEIFSYEGKFEISEMIIANSHSEVAVSMPADFNLSAAYPNPFNPSTTVNLQVPMQAVVSVQVYDLSGRMISSLLSGVQAQGNYSLTWNAADQASGMYLIRAEMADQVSVQKILLLK